MPLSPRRSTRGANPAAPASTTTSSSLSSSRQDRNARAANHQTSATPRSLSSEEIEPVRRSQRSHLKEDSPAGGDTEAVEDPDEEAIDEEEITRCICGHQDYPGPPLSEAFADVPDALSDDAGGLFILCDGCSVWQHGGCVGIVEESQSPDKYFCEECRPKMHAIHIDSRGQQYSLYIPLHPKARRKGSVSKHDDKAAKERELASRGSVDPATGRRRGTMRSKEHDDEEEQLKRAIEESKREVDDVSGGGRRTTKRGRDDSSEDKHDNKRQRTASDSGPSGNRTASLEDDSDGDGNPTISRAKKAKAEAAQSARQVKQAEQERNRERSRAEAAARRVERAKSRRNDEADQNDDGTPNPPPSNRASPPAGSSQPGSPAPAEKVSLKKGPGKKPVKKLGNNQYTKRNLELAASSPFGRKRNLQNNGTGSGDEGHEPSAGDVNGIGNTNGKASPGAADSGLTNGNSKPKFGRKKNLMTNGNGANKPANEEIPRTFGNMSLALSNMNAYVLRQQAEVATSANSEATSPAEDNTPSAGGNGGAVQAPEEADADQATEQMDVPTPEEWNKLSAAEMAAVVQKNIGKWQRLYGPLSQPVAAPAPPS